MKKIFGLMMALAMVIGLSVQAHATLILRGTGTSVAGTYNLIYDTDRNITWYDYTKSPDTWWNQLDWADALSVTFGSTVYGDWRLPITFDESCLGFNCTNSEMGHLYYTELGNPAGGLLANTGDFQNIDAVHYWSGTAYSADPANAWYFYFTSGDQDVGYKGNDGLYALAVYPGDVSASAPVPEPSTLLLLGSGLLGLAGIRKRFIPNKSRDKIQTDSKL